jgi:3-methyladenine DNA glycosylase AlkD
VTYDEVMAKLRDLRNDMIYKHNAKRGAGDNQFGVKSTDLRALAKQIKADPELTEQLWESGNLDAMLLATLIMKPKQMSVDDLNRLVGSVSYFHVADWLSTNVVKLHPQKESQRERWMNSGHNMTARMGWSLTTERVIKKPEGLDLNGLLDRIETQMGNAHEDVQWTMNYCLAEIGINFPEHRARAIAIGEKIGAFRDFPASKGCTSPYAPIWIAAMVGRKR